MPEALLESMFIAEPPDITYVITEDETPVDNIFSAKQPRLFWQKRMSEFSPPSINRRLFQTCY